MNNGGIKIKLMNKHVGFEKKLYLTNKLVLGNDWVKWTTNEVRVTDMRAAEMKLQYASYYKRWLKLSKDVWMGTAE